MRIARRTLYLGVFLISFGAVWLLARGQATDGWVSTLLGLWPVVVIAAGVGLLLRRTRLSLAGGILAAAVPGLLLGGVVVAAPDIASTCGADRTLGVVTSEGTFSGSSAVDLELDCGTATVVTAPGFVWSVTGPAGGDAPVVRSTGDRLSIVSASRGPASGSRSWDGGWDAVLPTGPTLDLDATVNAGKATLDLAGARLGRTSFDVNAGALFADLSAATFERLTLDVSAGAAHVALPSGSDAKIDVRVAAGKATLCVPADLGLRVRRSGDLGQVDLGGLVRVGSFWETPGYATAAHRAEVNLVVNVGSVDIAPEGACK